MYAIYLERGDDSLSLFGIRRSKHGGSKGEVCTTAFLSGFEFIKEKGSFLEGSRK